MKIIVNNCYCKNICDCNTTEECSIKQIIKECQKQREIIPKSTVRTHIQMGTLILADEILKICKDKYKKILRIRKKILCKMAINFLLHKTIDKINKKC